MSKKITITIKGMKCNGCEKIIKEAILRLGGIKNIKASHAEGKAIVEFDSAKTDTINIINAIRNAGYEAEVAEQ